MGDARTSFARLRGMKDDPGNPLVEDDINEMRQILEKEQQVGSGSWLECFNPNTGVPKLVYRTLLGIGIHFLQQWTGVNYFFYYGATVFQSSGVDDPILVQLILGAVNVVTTLYGLWVVERFGRRWPLVIGAFWQSAWLVIFGETFPLQTRAKQASLATAGNWLGNFMVGFLTPLATDGIGGSPGIKFAYGYVFAGTNFAAGLLVWFFLYESRTLSLENVDLMYGQEGLKPWTSHKWVPPGYISRKERDTSAFRNMSVSGHNGNGHMAGEKKSDENSEDFMPGTTREEHV